MGSRIGYMLLMFVDHVATVLFAISVTIHYMLGYDEKFVHRMVECGYKRLREEEGNVKEKDTTKL